MVKFDEQGLIPAIAQDARTGQVLMVAHMNAESLQRTLESGQAWFWSRSRRELWHKGATSGSFLNVKSVTADCDSDVLLLQVEPEGPACHTGAVSCFFEPVQGDATAAFGVTLGSPDAMAELFATIEARKTHQPDGSYVASLLKAGPQRVAKKVAEEGGEVAIAAVSESDDRVVSEVADLWFHSLILLASRNLTPGQVWAELESRKR
ncbi:MAG: bifunctional phosphoribosyl-AMP cyclohydrolase/phosphoribosyl-ATP diphosphatase HisIE [Dehalococcoidia bacterium]|nr:bifunctional phosphoribosyl-AMP cyclohydrolase/phosphoribosyl-ATP diphosphatase HisIE [Dehalococcoidia bacterium]